MSKYQIRKSVTIKYNIQEYYGNGQWGQLLEFTTEKEARDVLGMIISGNFNMNEIKSSELIFQVDTSETNNGK